MGLSSTYFFLKDDVLQPLFQQQSKICKPLLVKVKRKRRHRCKADCLEKSALLLLLNYVHSKQRHANFVIHIHFRIGTSNEPNQTGPNTKQSYLPTSEQDHLPNLRFFLWCLPSCPVYQPRVQPGWQPGKRTSMTTLCPIRSKISHH